MHGLLPAVGGSSAVSAELVKRHKGNTLKCERSVNDTSEKTLERLISDLRGLKNERESKRGNQGRDRLSCPRSFIKPTLVLWIGNIILSRWTYLLIGRGDELTFY